MMSRRIFFNPITGLFFRIKARPKRKAPVNAEVERLRAQAKEELPPRLAQLAAIHGFKYNKVFIKNNLSNWGSCSSLKNINLNLRLVTLPQELQDYVMLHELCHLKYLNHGPQFHALLESVCPGHRELARRMKEYRIK
ncbi:MAG: M48 family metallopeptidase [Bacteroidales bacterium]|nr:M48 family metallopeptidase [Bacteroidales bacterium]